MTDFDPAGPAGVEPAALSSHGCQVHRVHKPSIYRGLRHTVDLHHVQPMSYGGEDEPGNRVYVCPTGHVAIHELLREHMRRDGEAVPWSVRKWYGREERALALEGYRRWVAAGRPVTPHRGETV